MKTLAKINRFTKSLTKVRHLSLAECHVVGRLIVPSAPTDDIVRLIRPCSELELPLASTDFYKRRRHKLTWCCPPSSQRWTQTSHFVFFSPKALIGRWLLIIGIHSCELRLCFDWTSHLFSPSLWSQQHERFPLDTTASGRYLLNSIPV